MPQTFREKFTERADQHSPFCLGIDPSSEILSAWGFADDPQGLRDFCDRLGAWLGDDLALAKPQSACFERFGAAGALVLEQLIEDLRAAGVLTILDVKRGDIASTNESYAQAFFGASSPMAVDAMTTHPFLGFADLMPLLDAAQQRGGMVFVVAASSNESGMALQSARLASTADGGGGVSLTRALAVQIAAHEAAGAVVGVTRKDLTSDDFAAFGDSLVLTPGIGAQGGDFAALERFGNQRNLIPTASRQVFREGANKTGFLDALKRHQEAAFRLRS